MKRLLLPFASAVALDQLTKVAACASLSRPVPVINGFFDLRLAFNDGAAWSLFAGRRVFLCAVSIAMLVLLAYNAKDLLKTHLTRLATGLLAGGIVGNLIDRLRCGLVVDFLDFHWKHLYTFPTFNVADICICIGIGLLILDAILSSVAQKAPST